MPRPAPTCKNETCPFYRSREKMIVLQERPEDVTFGCLGCHGVQVFTLNWKRAEQATYEKVTKAEYGRRRRMFFQGKNQHIGG